MKSDSSAARDHLTILAVADEVSPTLYDRFDPGRWKNVDLLLSCGDLRPSYLDFLVSMLNVPLLYVRGNHDGYYPRADYAGGKNVHGRIVECKGLRIAGFEGCMWYNGQPVQYTERQMRAIVRRMRLSVWRHGKPDIVLAHAPPAGCHDASDTCHRGFGAFCTAIDAWQPSLFLHGHMHSYEREPRETEIGKTRVVHVFPFAVIRVPVPRSVSARQPVVQTGPALGGSTPGSIVLPG